MTLAGWIFMLLSVTVVVSLVVFCFYKLFTTETPPSMHAPLDIDTKDRGT